MEIDKIYKNTIIPSLTDVSYGQIIADNFKIINDNFNRLANIDFNKGAPGDSIYLESIDLKKDEYWNKKVREAIEGMGLGGLDPIDGVTMYKDFDENPGMLHLFYSYNGVNDKKYISSLVYTFLDARFNRDNLVRISDKFSNEYTEATDNSCNIIFDGSELKALQNFPVLYYDSSLGFCWKINSVKTGISSQGPQGKNGIDGQIYIVKINYYDENGEVIQSPNSTYEVIEVMDTNGNWTDVKDSTIVEKTNTVAIVITNKANNVDDYPFWISSVNKTDNSYIVTCPNEHQIAIVIDSEAFNTILSSIYVDGTNGARGLFLPMNKNNNNSHMIYAEDNNGDENYTNLHIAPVNDRDIDIVKMPDSKATFNINYNTVNIDGIVNIGDKVDIDGNIDIEGSAYIGKDVNIDGAVTIDKSLTVNSAVTIKGSELDVNTTSDISLISSGKMKVDNTSIDLDTDYVVYGKFANENGSYPLSYTTASRGNYMIYDYSPYTRYQVNSQSGIKYIINLFKKHNIINDRIIKIAKGQIAEIPNVMLHITNGDIRLTPMLRRDGVVDVTVVQNFSDSPITYKELATYNLNLCGVVYGEVEDTSGNIYKETAVSFQHKLTCKISRKSGAGIYNYKLEWIINSDNSKYTDLNNPSLNIKKVSYNEEMEGHYGQYYA